MPTQTTLAFRFADRDFLLNGRNGSDLVAQQMRLGSYEAPLPLLLMASVFLTPGLFLDVGANNGLYSILAGKVREDLSVVAFEPLPAAQSAFEVNIRLNGLEANVALIRCALSDSSGQAVLHIPSDTHGLLETSASLEADFKSADRTITVATRTLDEMSFPQAVGVIKIDVEGHEAAVLSGGRALIAKDRPVIFAEMLSGAAPAFASMTATFAQLGYAMFRLRPNSVVEADAIVFDPDAWNHAFVPSEAVGVFRHNCSFHAIGFVPQSDGR